MNIKNPWQVAALATMGAVVVFLLAACNSVHFDNPLPIPEAGLQVDKRILGSWVFSESKKDDEDQFILKEIDIENDETIFVHIYPRSSGWLDVFWVDSSPQDEYKNGRWMHGSGYTVKIKDTPILCLWPTEEISFKEREEQNKDYLKKSPQCMLVPYKVTDDGMLHVWGFDCGELEEKINDGKLAGEVEKPKFSTTIKVHASSGELVAFFNEVGVAELTRGHAELSFTRLRWPEPKPFSPPEKP